MVRLVQEKVALVPAGQWDSIDDARRRWSKDFLIQGYYVQINGKTILVSLGHYYSSLRQVVSEEMSDAMGALGKALDPLYGKLVMTKHPHLEKQNHCPELRGKYDCGMGKKLEITQTSYGVDEYYSYTYESGREIDFGAKDAGMYNGPSYEVKCTTDGLMVNGSLNRLTSDGSLEVFSRDGKLATSCRSQRFRFRD
jgi:hypothetical protein